MIKHILKALSLCISFPLVLMFDDIQVQDTHTHRHPHPTKHSSFPPSSPPPKYADEVSKEFLLFLMEDEKLPLLLVLAEGREEEKGGERGVVGRGGFGEWLGGGEEGGEGEEDGDEEFE